MIPLEDFPARHEGESCYLCEKPILKDEDVRYYGGPYVMHSSCVDKLIDHCRAEAKKKK